MFRCFVFGLVAFHLVLDAGVARANGVEFIGAYTWEYPDPAFGGVSGLEVSEDGQTLWAVGDRGRFLTSQIARDGQQITGLSETRLLPIKISPEDRKSTETVTDAEGLARGADGRMFVSFEGFHRVRELMPDDASTAPVPSPRNFAGLQRNSALEALAIDADGALYTLPERSGKLDRPFPVYRFKDGAWDIPFALPRRGAFLPVGADFGPDGRLYLLERNFLGIFGFLNRVRVFELDGDEIIREDTLLESRTPRHGNLEGISVWRDASGSIRLTMIEDDNFKPFQSTEIVEYRLTD